jgi:hypothetical protein
MRHKASRVNRRTDSCKPDLLAYMRHHARQSWKGWENIGASGQVLQWTREGVSIPFRHNRPPPPFNQGVSLVDATPRRITSGRHTRVCRRGASSIRSDWSTLQTYIFVSRLRFVPKPCKKQWRLICDLRHLVDYCTRKRLM